MKKIHIGLILLAIVSVLSTGCEENALDKEQYFKQLFIVGAKDVVSSFDVKYGDQPQSTYISIAISGTQLPDKSVNITLGRSDETVDWYNDKFMWSYPLKYRILEDHLYDRPTTAKLEAGYAYTRVPFSVETAELHPDSLYSITFTIESVSEYDYRRADTVLVMNLNLINDYSGDYQMTATKTEYGGVGQSVSVQRKLKALDKDRVRFFNGTSTEVSSTSTVSVDDYWESINGNCVVFEVSANGTVDTYGYGNLVIYNDTATYKDGTFTFSYYYDEDGKRVHMEGTLVKLEY